MLLDIDKINSIESKFLPFKPASTIVIDNGTYTCKAGFLDNQPQIIFRNRLFKYKEDFSIESIPSSSLRTMFEKDIIINMEILEGTIDKILDYLTRPNSVKKKKIEIENLIFTVTFDTPAFYLNQILSLFFDVYKFKKIQLGPDLFYSYLKNVNELERAYDDDFDVVISISYSNTTAFIIQNKNIISTFKLGFGGQLAGEYFLALINNKYSDISFKLNVKQSEYLLRYARAAINYNEDSMKIFNSIKEGHIEFIVVSSGIKYYTEEEKGTNKKKFVKKKIPGNNNVVVEEKNEIHAQETDFALQKDEKEEMVEEKNYDLNNDEDSNFEDTSKADDDNEKIINDDNNLSEEAIKEQRKQKMIYYSSMFRFKQKIIKQIKKLELNIEHLEEDLEKTLDINKYLDKIRTRYSKMKKEIKLRNIVRKEIKNNKSVEFLIMMKVNNGFPLILPEEKIYQSIKDATDEELSKIMDDDLEKYHKILQEMDPGYLFEKSPISYLRGDHVNLDGLCIDLELLKIPEIFFEPSIIGLSQPGLKDFFDEIRNLKIKNVLLTGGFSNITDLDKRIEIELTQNSFTGSIKVKRAENSEYDAFCGANFDDTLPIYTREEYEKYGSEELIKKYNKFN